MLAFYDGMCVICNQTRRIIKSLDWRDQIEWLDVQQWVEVGPKLPGVDYETALGQIHVRDGGTTYGGFFGTRRMLRALPLTYPLWLLLHLPGMSWIGQRVYRFIARHRYTINRWLGAPVCEDGTCKLPGA